MAEAKIKKAWYKQWWAIVLFVIIGLMIIGGISSNNQTPIQETNTNTQTSPPPSVQPPAETPTELNLRLGEMAETNIIEVAVIWANKVDSYDYTGFSGANYTQEASSGKIYILVDAQIKNIGSDSAYVGSTQFSMTDSEGYKYDPELYLGQDADGLDMFKELYQNQKMRGKILFEVPKTAQGLKVLYDFGNIVSGTKLASWTV